MLHNWGSKSCISIYGFIARKIIFEDGILMAKAKARDHQGQAKSNTHYNSIKTP